jgi:hypothetical protein
MHGIGVEGKKVDVDVCDDCAGGAILLSVEANQRAREHIDQGKKLHEKLEAQKKKGMWKTKKVSDRVKVTYFEAAKRSPRDDVLCRTCRDKQEERKKKVKFVEERNGVFKVRTRGGKR